MKKTLQEKKESLIQYFAQATTHEERYRLIIDLGKKQKPLSPDEKKTENLVTGCQSRTYLTVKVEDPLVRFQIESEAQISAGLGQLLVMIYDGEAPENILKDTPTFLKEMNILPSLSPGRANGVIHMFHTMRKKVELAASST